MAVAKARLLYSLGQSNLLDKGNIRDLRTPNLLPLLPHLILCDQRRRDGSGGALVDATMSGGASTNPLKAYHHKQEHFSLAGPNKDRLAVWNHVYFLR